MKKKILTVIVLCFSLMLTMILNGCGEVAEVKSIEVIGNAYSEFVVGQTYDYENIKLRVTFKDGSTETVTAKDADGNGVINVVGFDTSSATQNGKMTISYTDEKGNTVSCDLGYTVYTVKQTVAHTGDVDKITSNTTNDDDGILFFSRSGEYDLSNYKIKRNLIIIARTGEDVVLKDVRINPTADISVSFKNVTITNSDKFVGSYKVLIDVTQTNNVCNLLVNNCKLKANGKSTVGINVPRKGNFEVNSCEFITEDKQNDIFNYGVQVNANRDMTYDFKIVKNVIDCNFQYLFMNMYKGEFIGNHIYSTLSSQGLGEFAPNGVSQTTYVNKKNPVVLHYEPSKWNFSTVAENQKFEFIVKDNTVNNAQNFMRIYNMDTASYQAHITWKFSGNNLSNIAVLVNGSGSSFKDLGIYVNKVKEDTNITANCYLQEYKTVMTMNTQLQLTNPNNVYRDTTSTATLYYNISQDNEVTANLRLQLGMDTYIYVGSINSKFFIMKDGAYYRIDSVAYSPTGDVITFTANSGTTLNIANARRYTRAEVYKMAYGVDLVD